MSVLLLASIAAVAASAAVAVFVRFRPSKALAKIPRAVPVQQALQVGDIVSIPLQQDLWIIGAWHLSDASSPLVSLFFPSDSGSNRGSLIAALPGKKLAECRPIAQDCSGNSLIRDGQRYSRSQSLVVAVRSEGKIEAFSSLSGKWSDFLAPNGSRVFSLSSGTTHFAWIAQLLSDSDIQIMAAGKATLREVP